MADIVYRGNLKASGFPFLSEFSGRSVIVRGQDQNYIPGLAAKEAIDSVAGIPQIYYAHNVIPTDAGYRAVGYSQHVASASEVSGMLHDLYVLRDSAGRSAHFSMDSVGKLFLLKTGSGVWRNPAGAPTPADVVNRNITVAFVSGVTYIYFSGYGCYYYDFDTEAFVSVTLTGLVAADIIGIVAASGYLLAYSVDAVAWCSTIDATDFTPDLATGAGGGNLEGALGNIITARAVGTGIIFFCAENAVGGVWNNNIRYPFSFTAIAGSGGLADQNYVSADDGLGNIIAYTKSGLQSITLQKAGPVFPEVTDFLAGARFETFDTSTLSFSIVEQGTKPLLKRLAYIADRYLIISYGFNERLTDALYYDAAYKQWGRLHVEHVDCVELAGVSNAYTEIPKKSIAFMTFNGKIQILNSDLNSGVADGVLILGKYQYVRSRLLTLQSVEFENVETDDNFSLYDLPTLDGKTFESAVEGYEFPVTGKSRKYGFLNTAANHSVVCIGAFNAVSIVLTFTVHGAW